MGCMAARETGIRAKLEAKGLVGTCEACGTHTRWTVASDQYVLSTVGGGTESRMPIHATVCGNCGNVRLFNAHML